MKLKYSFVSLLALAAALVGCEKEADHYLSEIQVSSSYVSLPKAGGDAEITLTAEGPWEVSQITDEAFKEEIDWLTVTPKSGAAGETTVKFHADAPEALRKAIVVFSCNGKTQNINIIQDAEVSEKPEVPITPIATVIAEGDGTWRVRGTVTKVVNDQYGNFYMIDDSYNGPDFQIYGTKNEKGQYPKEADGGWASFGIEAGDIVTVEGPYSLYKTTHELVDVSVIAIEKSLIQIESIDYGMDGEEARTTIAAEGGEIVLKVASKVSPIIVTTEADWLKLTDIKDGDYILTAAANDYTAVRKATITVKAEDALATVEVTQDGIPATGATVTDIIAMADASEVETLESTVIAKTGKGVVIYDGTTACYVYGDKAADVKVGDNVKVFGTKKTYNGVPEIELSKDNDTHKVDVISSGNSFNAPEAKDVTADAETYTASKAEYIKITGTLTVSGNYYNIAFDGIDTAVKQGSVVAPTDDLGVKDLNGKKITVTGWFNGLSSGGKFLNVIATKVVEFVDNPKGSETNPYKPTEICALILGGNIPDENVYIRGIISDIRFTFSADYGTAQFWISDDGTNHGISEDHKTTTDAANDFLCYGVYFKDGQPWKDGDAQIELGAEVLICGKVTLYNGLAETSNKNAWVQEITTGGSAAAITIDGDMSDWASVEGAETPDSICKVMKVTNDADNFYVYLASAPGSRGSQLWGEAAGYYYLDFDWDNDETTGIAENSNPGFDCWCYLYIFGGTADAPEIKLNPNGDGTQMSISNITAKGVITSELIEIELSIPRADMVEVAAGTEARILSWRSKDGTKITQIYTVK